MLENSETTTPPPRADHTAAQAVIDEACRKIEVAVREQFDGMRLATIRLSKVFARDWNRAVDWEAYFWVQGIPTPCDNSTALAIVSRLVRRAPRDTSRHRSLRGMMLAERFERRFGISPRVAAAAAPLAAE